MTPLPPNDYQATLQWLLDNGDVLTLTEEEIASLGLLEHPTTNANSQPAIPSATSTDTEPISQYSRFEKIVVGE